MKNIFLTSLVLFSSCLLFASCEKKLPEDAIYDPRHSDAETIMADAQLILDRVDHIFMKENYQVELYIQTADDKGIKKVPHFEDIPENISATYNIIRNKDGNIMYAAEFPYSQSGDYENIYESIYNTKGDLIKFVRKSSFFHSDTLNTDVVAYEKSEYYYNLKHKLLKKTYVMKYGPLNKVPLGVKVEFPYRFKYKKYKTRKKWLRAHDLEK